LAPRYITIICLLLTLLFTFGCSEKTAIPETNNVQNIARSNQLVMAGSGANIPVTAKLYESHRWKIVYRDKDMSEILHQTKGAFGITVATEIAKENSKIKPLDYNGISPTTENVRNGSYILTEDLSFVYKDPLSSRTSEFFDYVFSAEGQHILNNWGASPLGR